MAHHGKSQSPVAISTGRRESEFLKLDEEAAFGAVSEHSGRNESEREVAPRQKPQESEPSKLGRKKSGMLKTESVRSL
jgi:hypothetical protein